MVRMMKGLMGRLRGLFSGGARAYRVDVAVVERGDGGLRVRKVEYGASGLVRAKYGLSAVTGKWVRIPEAAWYPDETAFTSFSSCDRTWTVG